jgi:hypothetical protein
MISILNKYILILFCFFSINSVFSQEEIKTKKSVQKQKIKYIQEKGYNPFNGTQRTNSQRKENTYNNDEDERTYNEGIEYDEERIKSQREETQRDYGSSSRGDSYSGGPLPTEPEIERPKRNDTYQSRSTRNNTYRDNKPSNLGFFKMLIILAAVCGVVYLIYFLINKKSTQNLTIPDNTIKLDQNPIELEDDELTKRIKALMLEEEYRACIRVYFNYILKELIQKDFIQWEKDKTNYDYLLEMERKNCKTDQLRIIAYWYDVIWYGEYHLDRFKYDQVSQVFINYYTDLTKN